jgi:hypothetical protein
MKEGSWGSTHPADGTWCIPRLETSTNLIHWHAARGDEVRVESNYGYLTGSLLPSGGNLFTRVRSDT